MFKMIPNMNGILYRLLRKKTVLRTFQTPFEIGYILQSKKDICYCFDLRSSTALAFSIAYFAFVCSSSVYGVSRSSSGHLIYSSQPSTRLRLRVVAVSLKKQPFSTVHAYHDDINDDSNTPRLYTCSQC